MKRSEMIKLITHFTNLHCIKSNNSSQSPSMSFEGAAKLLSFLEDKGMAPPEIETKYYDRANCEYHRVHEWEPEDNGNDDNDPNYCGAV